MHDVDEQRQAALNAGKWAQGEHVELYAGTELRPVEAALIERYRAAMRGSVLELGCGGGRLTGHLVAAGGRVHGIDLSAAMVEHCRRAYPQAEFSVADLRDLSAFAQGAFAVVFAPFNVLDVLGHDARRRVLLDIRRLLVPEGLLIFSSHNRDYARRPGAKLKLAVRLLIGAPRRPLASIRGLPRRISNRRRLRRLQREEPGYAIVNDEAHDFSVLHYYVSRDVQAREIAELGYTFLECLDLSGAVVRDGDVAAHDPELHYVARL
jgi:SAM-dependent methyltransferase